MTTALPRLGALKKGPKTTRTRRANSGKNDASGGADEKLTIGKAVKISRTIAGRQEVYPLIPGRHKVRAFGGVIFLKRTVNKDIQEGKDGGA